MTTKLRKEFLKIVNATHLNCNQYRCFYILVDRLNPITCPICLEYRDICFCFFLINCGHIICAICALKIQQCNDFRCSQCRIVSKELVSVQLEKVKLACVSRIKYVQQDQLLNTKKVYAEVFLHFFCFELLCIPTIIIPLLFAYLGQVPVVVICLLPSVFFVTTLSCLFIANPLYVLKFYQILNTIL